MLQIHGMPISMQSFLQSARQTATSVLNNGYSRLLSKLLHSSGREKKVFSWKFFYAFFAAKKN
jgi:hypothetical protein